MHDEHCTNFCKVGELVLDTFTSTLTTAVSCSQLPENGRLVGCEQDSDCQQDAIASLVEVYGEPVVSLDSKKRLV